MAKNPAWIAEALRQVLPRATGSMGGASRTTYDADKGRVKDIKDLLERLITKLSDQHESVTIILT